MDDLKHWEKISAFQRGVWYEEFIKNLTLDPLTNFADLVAQIQRFMALKETNWCKRDLKRKAPKGKCKGRATLDTCKEEFTPLLVRYVIVSVEGERRRLIYAVE